VTIRNGGFTLTDENVLIPVVVAVIKTKIMTVDANFSICRRRLK